MLNTVETAEEKDEDGNVTLVQKPVEVNVVNAAALSNKLLQFANGAVYDEDKNVFPIHNIKLDALKEIVENSNGQSILVAWTYQFDKDRILEYLKSYKPRELKTNKDIEDWNAGRIQVMLAHLEFGIVSAVQCSIISSRPTKRSYYTSSHYEGHA